MSVWSITYTTDGDVTRKSFDVEANTMTEALLQGMKDLPRECFIGENQYAAVLSVIKQENSSKNVT